MGEKSAVREKRQKIPQQVGSFNPGTEIPFLTGRGEAKSSNGGEETARR